MQIKLSRATTYKLNSMPRGRLHKNPIKNSCNIPWKHITVDLNGDVLLCTCDAWLPIPVGTVDDFDSLESIWTSEAAQLLQQNIVDKKFTWCAVEHCGILRKNIHQQNHTLHLNIDESCNLACPSCRRDLRMLDSGPDYEKKLNQLNRIIGWLEKFDKPIQVTMSGNGDPLASRIIRPLIRNYTPKTGQTIKLRTNGLLMKKILDDNPIKDSIVEYAISVDAGSKEVYEKVRRPGKWEVLIENLEWLKQNKKNSRVVLAFVIQKDNFRDLPMFVDLCERFNFAGGVGPLDDWGTWNRTEGLNPDQYTIQNGTFLDHDVANPSHPDHLEFIQVIKAHRHKISFGPYFLKFF